MGAWQKGAISCDTMLHLFRKGETLPAQKGRDLEDVHDFPGDGGLRFGVNVRQDRDADRLANFGQDVQPRLQPLDRETIWRWCGWLYRSST